MRKNCLNAKLAAAHRDLLMAQSGMDAIQSELDTVAKALLRIQSNEQSAATPLTQQGSITRDSSDLESLRLPAAANRTVDVDSLLLSLQHAQAKSLDINQRIDRARRFSQDSVDQPYLLPPETLFHNSSTRDIK